MYDFSFRRACMYVSLSSFRTLFLSRNEERGGSEMKFISGRNGTKLKLCGSRPETRPKMSLFCTYRETRDPVCFFEMKRVQNASRESRNESQNDFFVRKAIHSSVLGRVWDASFVLERFPKRVPFILLGLVFGTRFNMRTTVGLGLVRHSSTDTPFTYYSRTCQLAV